MAERPCSPETLDTETCVVALTDGGSSSQVASDGEHPSSVQLFEHSIDAVLLSAPDGRILAANAAACRMLRLRENEIRKRGRAGLADPHDSRWVRGVEERKRTGRFAGRLSFIRGDRTTVELDVTSAVFPTDDGELRTVIVMREAIDEKTLTDASGVLSRQTFIAFAEERLRRANREHLRVGLVYIRAEEQTIGHTLSAESRAGDIVGRVALNDFVVLVTEHDADSASAVARRVARCAAPFRAHVGFIEIDTDAVRAFVEIVDEATKRVDQHESLGPDVCNPATRGCLFDLSSPRTLVELGEPTVALTTRESEVLQLLAARRSYQEIARTLYVSLNTVKTHVSRIYAKLGVNGRRAAVQRATALGLASGPPPRNVDRAVDFGRITLIAEALTAAVDADDVLEIVVMQGLRGLHADGAIATFIVDDALVPVATYGYAREAIDAFFPARLAEELPITVAAREQRMVWVPSREGARHRYPTLTASPAAHSKAWIAAPLVAEGRAFGALGVSFLDAHEFDEAERSYLRTLCDLCALSLHQHREVRLRGNTTES